MGFSFVSCRDRIDKNKKLPSGARQYKNFSARKKASERQAKRKGVGGSRLGRDCLLALQPLATGAGIRLWKRARMLSLSRLLKSPFPEPLKVI